MPGVEDIIVNFINVICAFLTNVRMVEKQFVINPVLATTLVSP